MGKILVTGGGGFIGSVLCDELLSQGYEVRVLDNLFRKSDYLISLCKYPHFEFVHGDILDTTVLKKALEGVDGVVHLAALVGEPICRQMPDLATLVNLEGTKNVVSLKDKGIPIIFASTGSCYGKVEGVCTEDSPLNAVSHYGKLKIDCETVIRRCPSHIIYRFSTAFGVSGNMRVNLLVNDLVHRAVHDGAFVVFQGDFRRSFIHVRDIVDGIIYGLKNFDDMKGETYNVGHDAGNWTKRELAEYIKGKTNCYVSYAGTGYIDPDQRDYEISYGRIHAKGWHANISVEQGIDELVKAAKVMKITHSYL